MVLATAQDLSQPFAWPEEGVTRVPFRLFSDEEIYALEQERIFRGPVWNYLCLEIDVPNPGDFKTTTVGEVPVVVTRDEDGALHAMVNRCAHKGALVCLKERGNAKDQIVSQSTPERGGGEDHSMDTRQHQPVVSGDSE